MSRVLVLQRIVFTLVLRSICPWMPRRARYLRAAELTQIFFCVSRGDEEFTCVKGSCGDGDSSAVPRCLYTTPATAAVRVPSGVSRSRGE